MPKSKISENFPEYSNIKEIKNQKIHKMINPNQNINQNQN